MHNTRQSNLSQKTIAPGTPSVVNFCFNYENKDLKKGDPFVKDRWPKRDVENSTFFTTAKDGSSSAATFANVCDIIFNQLFDKILVSGIITSKAPRSG